MGIRSKLTQPSTKHGVSTSILRPDQDFILNITPSAEKSDLFSWIKENQAYLLESLLQHGALRFTGFNLTPEEFALATDLALPEDQSLLNYTAGVSRRTKVKDDLFLSTTLSNKAVLLQHNEMSYMPNWPSKIAFYCDIEPPIGGETPICSNRQFTKKLDPKIFQRFTEKKVKYIRNYRSDSPMGVSWEQSFETDDKKQIEAHCKKFGFEFTWLPGNRLKTSNLSQGSITHPKTGDVIWFNHAYMLNNGSDNPNVPPPGFRAFLPAMTDEIIKEMKATPPTELPHNSFYGDGSLIESSVIEELHSIYMSESVAFKWQKGDFIILDNLLASHGRNPFEGDRRILTILKEAKTQPSLKIVK